MNTDQTVNSSTIAQFLVHGGSIMWFLELTAVCTIFLVVFGQPTSILDYVEQTGVLSPLAQVSIGALSGFAVLMFCRAMLYLIGKKSELNLTQCIILLLVEAILCVAVVSLVLWALSGAGRMQLAPFVGDLLLSIVGLELAPYVISFLIYRLRLEHAEVLRLREMLPKPDRSDPALADRIINFYDKGNRLVFATKSTNVLYVEAADNYANIHYINEGKEDCFILHNSLKEMERAYSDSGLLRCHRGYMVNVENVKLMRKENNMIQLEINEVQKPIPVSKSYEKEFMRRFSS